MDIWASDGMQMRMFYIQKNHRIVVLVIKMDQLDCLKAKIRITAPKTADFRPGTAYLCF